MKKESIYLILFFTLFSLSIYANKNVRLTSPNGKIKFSLALTEKSPVYNIEFNKQMLIQDSPLTLTFDNGAFGEKLKMSRPVFSTKEETYELIVGKAKHIHSLSKEVIIPLEETVQPFRKINLVVRAFDDGIAFRYEFPKQKGWDSYIMYDEGTSFNLQGNPSVTTLFLPNYQSSHEGKYTVTDYADMDNKRLMDMPALFSFPNHVYMAITEAAVRDYAGMYLWKENGALLGKLSPKLGQERIKVEASLPHQSPWRVLMISDQIGSLIASNILTNLNEPCKIEDTSWIKPGKTTFTWWNGNVVPDTTFLGGNNLPTNKYYIDFASRFGIEYVILDEGWAVPGKADLFQVIPEIDLEELVSYAKSKNVDLILWAGYRAFEKDMDRVCKHYAAMGIKGFKIDFMDRDDQHVVEFNRKAAETGAKYKLLIDLHGTFKPTGLQRTYPNTINFEGVHGLEELKWAESGTDQVIYDVTVPFIRMVAGPMDYTQGAMNNVIMKNFHAVYTEPMSQGTRCRQLALYTIFDSPINMLCDAPTNYMKEEECTKFIASIPTVWDQTLPISGKVGEHIVMARQKDGIWYVGGLTDWNARDVEVDLSFLGKGEFNAEIFKDGINADRVGKDYKREVVRVSADRKLKLHMAPGGGFVVKITK